MPASPIIEQDCISWLEKSKAVEWLLLTANFGRSFLDILAVDKHDQNPVDAVAVKP